MWRELCGRAGNVEGLMMWEVWCHLGGSRNPKDKVQPQALQDLVSLDPVEWLLGDVSCEHLLRLIDVVQAAEGHEGSKAAFLIKMGLGVIHTD